MEVSSYLIEYSSAMKRNGIPPFVPACVNLDARKISPADRQGWHDLTVVWNPKAGCTEVESRMVVGGVGESESGEYKIQSTGRNSFRKAIVQHDNYS